jgi:hypothetical protein
MRAGEAGLGMAGLQSAGVFIVALVLQPLMLLSQPWVYQAISPLSKIEK